jgi:hypothetical protein
LFARRRLSAGSVIFSIEAWLKPSSLIGEPHRMRFTFSRDVTLSIEITTQGV